MSLLRLRSIFHGRSARLMSAQSVISGGPVENSIRLKLTSSLEPTSLTVANDSWKHRHHREMIGHGGGNEETHFSITIISHAFQGKSLMQRHRMIYTALADELEQGLHALSLVTKTPEELPEVPQ